MQLLRGLERIDPATFQPHQRHCRQLGIMQQPAYVCEQAEALARTSWSGDEDSEAEAAKEKTAAAKKGKKKAQPGKVGALECLG